MRGRKNVNRTDIPHNASMDRSSVVIASYRNTLRLRIAGLARQEKSLDRGSPQGWASERVLLDL